jgi:ABC-2 type transport system ATP-binding protein
VRRSIVLHELTPERGSLEEAFMDVTRDAVEFHAVDSGTTPTPVGGPSV